MPPAVPPSPGDRLRIALVDDHPLIMEGIAHALSPFPDMEVVLQATSGHAFLTALRHGVQADVALVDLRMPGMDGFEVLAHLQEEFPAARAIVLSLECNLRWVRRAGELGARGFLLKDADGGVVRRALQAVREGGTCWWQPERVDGSDTISAAHLRFLELLCDPADHTFAQIADIMRVSHSTVEGYFRYIGQALRRA